MFRCGTVKPPKGSTKQHVLAAAPPPTPIDRVAARFADAQENAAELAIARSEEAVAKSSRPPKTYLELAVEALNVAHSAPAVLSVCPIPSRHAGPSMDDAAAHVSPAICATRRHCRTDGGTEGGSLAQGGSGLTVLEIGNRIAAAYPAYYGEGGPATAGWRHSCVRMPVRNVTDMCHRRARG